MSKIIIGIHGLANKPNKRTLASWWKGSIAEGLRKNLRIRDARFRFHMVYWANLLYKYQLHSNQAFTFDSLYNTQPYLRAGPNELQRYDDGWYDVARGTAREYASRGLYALKEAVGMDPVADLLLQKKLRDLQFYWDKKRKIQDRQDKMRVAAQVLDNECKQAIVRYAQHDIMLIAHSMGSIISYNVLRDLGRPDTGVRVPCYVTIGSPLGLQMVKDQIQELRWDHEVRTPSIVTERWVNFADRRDAVAFDTHLRDDYRENASEIRVRDDLVLNDYQAKGKHNYHKSYGYLRTPEMSELVAEFLGL